MFTNQVMKATFISVLCVLILSTSSVGVPSKLSTPNTLVVAYPQNNVSLGSPINLGFDDPPLPTNYYGFWHNTTASLRYPNGTVQPYLSAWSVDCIGSLTKNIINSDTPIEYTGDGYPTTDTGLYAESAIIFMLQSAHQ